MLTMIVSNQVYEPYTLAFFKLSAPISFPSITTAASAIPWNETTNKSCRAVEMVIAAMAASPILPYTTE